MWIAKDLRLVDRHGSTESVYDHDSNSVSYFEDIEMYTIGSHRINGWSR